MTSHKLALNQIVKSIHKPLTQNLRISKILLMFYLNQNFISTQKGPGVPPTRGRGVFPVTALMSHGCVSNARYIMIVDNSDEGNIRVRPISWLCVNLFCNTTINHMQL